MVDVPSAAGPVRRQSASGTPKRGYDCTDCLDYRTVVEVTAGAHGNRFVEKPCPTCQATDGSKQ